MEEKQEWKETEITFVQINSSEYDYLKTKVEMYEVLMNWFCDRCEKYEVRSRNTYSKFCDALGRENKLFPEEI